MSLNKEYVLKENKPLSLFKKYTFLKPFCFFLFLLLSFSTIQYLNKSSNIGIVDISGAISSSDRIIKDLQFFEKEQKTKAIILRINSPGGGVVPSQEVYSEVLRIRKKKPIYASLSSVAASGGYYIAAAANKIYAKEGTITGSIGVIMQNFNVEGLLDKIGIKAVVVKSGKNKDIGSMFRNMKPREEALLKQLINETQKQFVRAILKTRKISKKRLLQIADGRILNGEQALKEKLVDKIGGFYDVISDLKKELKLSEKKSTIKYAPRDQSDFVSELTTKISTSILKSLSSYSSFNQLNYQLP